MGRCSSFVSEILGFLFLQEFHGYTGMDLEQYWRRVYTRVHRVKGYIHRHPRKHVPYGEARFDADVWSCLGPCNAKQASYDPRWDCLQIQLDKVPKSEYSSDIHRID